MAHPAPISTTSGSSLAHTRLTALLALTLWHHGHSQPVRALEALAAVILNQARRNALPGPALPAAALAAACRWQGPERAGPEPTRPTPDDPLWAVCRRIARRALAGNLADPTGGAVRWHRRDRHPPWAAGRAPALALGELLFYPPEEE